MGWNGQRAPRFGDRGGRLHNIVRNTFAVREENRNARLRKQLIEALEKAQGVFSATIERARAVEVGPTQERWC